jgi:hypothetical protein
MEARAFWQWQLVVVVVKFMYQKVLVVINFF